jgi:hypothetical protein
MGHTARTALVIAFIAAVATVAIYCAQRRTVARGDIFAAELVRANPRLERMECDKTIPIRVEGATFACTAFFKSGESASYTFRLDREGHFEKLTGP